MMLFSTDVHWNTPPLNWRNCLLHVLKMLLENSFTLCLNELGLILFVTFWKLTTATLLLHADWMIVKNVSNQGGANSVTPAPWHSKSQLRMLVALKTAFLKNYLAGSTWICNGSSLECHKKKYQPFSSFGVRFGSQAIQIFEWKSAWRWSGGKWAFHPWLLI